MTETNTTPQFPPGRYGRRRQRRAGQRWIPIALGAVVVAVGVVAAVLLGQQYGPGRPYDARVERFYPVADDQVVVVFTVVVPDGESAICAVRSRGADGAEVGREEVRVDPAPGVNRPEVEHPLSTTAPPVTGEVQRCWQAPAG